MDTATREYEESTEDFHLRRMIMIDSYRKGSISELRLDGHTSINGLNAAGKTTLLRLIPLFYGESPNSLVQGGGINKAFSAFYLPHTTSYIIFEYLRRSLPCMAVLHASGNGEKVCYRFIDQSYAKERFVDEDGEIVMGADLKKHLTKRNEFCTEQISVLSDYRSIIQNTVSKKEHRPLAARFAYVGAGGKLGHIEKIATGMFSRVTSFRDLQRMIASCIDDAGQSVKLESSKSAMEDWVKEYRAYQLVMGHAGRMNTLNESHLRYTAAAGQLWGVHREFLLLKHQHETTIQACQDEIDDRGQKMDVLDSNTISKLSDLGRQQGAAEGKAKQLKEQIDTLDARKEAYTKDEIEALAKLVDSISQLEKDLAEQESRESALLGTSENLVNKYDKLKNARTSDFMTFDREQSELKDPLRAQADEATTRLTELANSAWQVLEHGFEEQEQGLLDEKNTIAECLGGLRNSALSPQPDILFVEKVEQARGALGAAQEKQTKALDEFQTAAKSYSDAVQAFNTIDGRIHALNANLIQEDARRDHLLSLASASPDTLLHFLREFRPEWTADIARVVPEEILLRNDLAPSLVGEGSTSLYGISLDLSVIDAPRVIDEETLRGQIEVSDQAISQLKLDIKTKENELAAQSKRVADGRAENDRFDRQRIQAESEAKSYKTALVAAEREMDEDRRRAGAKAKSEIAVKEALHEKNRRALDSLKAARKTRRQAHDNSLKHDQQTVHSTLIASLALIDTAISTAKSVHDKTIGALNAELVSGLKTAGVDTVSLIKLQAGTTEIKGNLSRGRAGIAKVGTWRHWLKDEWSKKPTLQKDFELHTATVRDLAGQQVKLGEVRTQQHVQHNLALTTLRNQKKETEQLAGYVSKRVVGLAPWPVDPAEVAGNLQPSKSQDVLEADMDRLLGEIKTETTRANEHVRVIKRAMFENRDTTPCSFYEKRRLGLGPDHENGSPFLWVPYLREWYDDAHRDARSLLLSQCRTFSGGVHEFHERLTKFCGKVDNFSKDLQKQMSSAIHFQKINGITVRLSTSFGSVGEWGKIQALANSYNEWAGIDSSELPSDDFAAAVSHASSALQGRNTIEVRLEDLISIEIDIDEVGQPTKTVKDEHQLKEASSNGLSYLILCVVFVGLINKIRRNEPVTLVWALDELRDLDLGNIESLLDLLSENNINLVSAYPDADPDILRLFKTRYEVLDGYKLAIFRLPEEIIHV